MRAVLAGLLAALLTIGVVASQPSSAAEGLTLSVGDQSGLERDLVTGSVFVPIYLSEPASEPVVVSYWTLDGTATANVDYARWGTPSNPRTVTIPAGATQTQVNVPILTDDEVEADETFSVVATATGGDVVVGDDTGTATIIDADALSELNPTITVSNPTVIEGDSGDRRAQFQVHLSRAPLTNVTISYTTVDATAVSGEDYVAKLPGTVVFAPGQISKTIDVLVNPNTSVDGDRTFALDVAVIGGSPVEELNMTGTATITDDDVVPGPSTLALAYTEVDGVDGYAEGVDVLIARLVDSNSDGVPSAGDVIQTDRFPRDPQRSGFGEFRVKEWVVESVISADDALVRVTGDRGDFPPTFSWYQRPNFDMYWEQEWDLVESTWFRTDKVAPFSCPSSGNRLQIQRTQSDPDYLQSTPLCQAPPNGALVTVEIGTTAATPCPPGTYNTTDGNEPCEPAPPGTYVDTPGALQATPCAPGSFQDQAGQTECQLAPIGSYVDTAGAAAVTACPDGTTTLTTGSTSAEDCVLQPVNGAIAVSSGDDHSCALLEDGTARCWGNNSAGQLGDGTTTASSVPVEVFGLSDAVAIDAGAAHTCALLEDGTARCWGSNAYGSLGDGTTLDSNIPVSVSGLANAVGISAGGTHTCAVLGDGTARCWGLGGWDGQLGDGTTSSSSVPVAVSGLTSAVAISAGRMHSCALLGDGTARCWGSNFTGRLGDGTLNQNSRVPVIVSGLTDAITISAGNHHTCAALGDGTARCWGQNLSNSLGDGSGVSSNVPVLVQGLTNAVAVSPGANNSCALLSDGTARCWGHNNYGQLGDGTTTDSSVPVVVSGLSDAVAITGGTSYSCAVLADGTGRCWGRNDLYGQLGDGTTANSSMPVVVVGIP